MLTPRPIVKPTTGEISLKRYLNEDELWTIPTIGLEPRDLPCSWMSSMMGTVEPVMRESSYTQYIPPFIFELIKFCDILDVASLTSRF